MKYNTTITNEAFTFRKNELGQTNFSSSNFSDPHIVKSMNLIAPAFGLTLQQLEKYIQQEINEFQKLVKASPILNETMSKNLVESTLFNALWKGKLKFFNPSALSKEDLEDFDDENTTEERRSEIIEKAFKQIEGKSNLVKYVGASTFSPRIFMQLDRMIKVEHSQFFPLRNFTDGKYLHSPRIILVPSSDSDHKKWGNIDTAAATPTGYFIYNTHFMQRLIDWAHLKGVKSTSKKYVSNGGPIPDDWVYIEFVIMHEYMHFSYGDFHYDKILKPRNGKKANQQIINYVGDFRSNYLMVKSGFHQLPLGLFSDYINYDRQQSYQEMYDLVEDELKKLPKSDQTKTKIAMDGLSGDDHGQHGEGGDEESGDGDKSDIDKIDPSEIDKANEDIEKKISNSKDSGDDQGSSPSNHGSPTMGRIGSPGQAAGSGREFDPNSIKPHFSWKQILNQAVKVNSPPEETYQKPNRRSITGAMIARQRGESAVKPGEVASQGDVKLLFVIDDSGSMSNHNEMVYANIFPLLKQRSVTPKFTIIKFSGTHSTWDANVKNNTATNIHTGEKDSVTHLMSTAESGGTVLTQSIVEDIRSYVKKDYNVIMVSDTDVIHGGNLIHLKQILEMKAFMIFATREDFITAANSLKSISNRISHL